MKISKIRVYQDGNSFYQENKGLIFRASIIVKDGDMKAAELARDEFKKFAWMNYLELTWI